MHLLVMRGEKTIDKTFADDKTNYIVSFIRIGYSLWPHHTDLLNGCHDYMLHRFFQGHYDLDIL